MNSFIPEKQHYIILRGLEGCDWGLTWDQAALI